jgi:phosphoribosylanthranilate isomerase
MAIAHGADALGLVGEMPSGPGPIDDDTARAIAQLVPPPIATFLLTSKTTGVEIVDHVRYCSTDTVQIVSHIEPGEYAAIINKLPHVRRVQVIHVEDDSALDLIADYAPFVHAFLLDSGRPQAPVVELGGTGRTHDWQISQKFVQATDKPVFLAGGLTPENIDRAITTVTPYGVDLCSGVRSEGALDSRKLAAFMAHVR